MFINQCHLSHFNEKTSFQQSQDKRVYVKMSLDKKGEIARPFCRPLVAGMKNYLGLISHDLPTKSCAGCVGRCLDHCCVVSTAEDANKMKLLMVVQSNMGVMWLEGVMPGRQI